MVVLKLRSLQPPVGHLMHRCVARRRHSTLKRILLSHIQSITLVSSLAVPWPALLTGVLIFCLPCRATKRWSPQPWDATCMVNPTMQLFYGLIMLFDLADSMFVVLALFWFVVVPGGGDGSLATLGCITCMSKWWQQWCACRIFRQPPCAEQIPCQALRICLPAHHAHVVPSAPQSGTLGFDIFNCRHVGQPVDGKPRYLHIAMEEQCWGRRTCSMRLVWACPCYWRMGWQCPL